MAGTSDQISNIMFGSENPYDLGVQPSGVFTLKEPYESGFSRTSGNADQKTKWAKILHIQDVPNWYLQF